MTTINSICVKCKNLEAYTTGACVSNGVRSLISRCILYCGKNSGNRKTCKYFEIAHESVIAKRIEALEEEKDAEAEQ